MQRGVWEWFANKGECRIISQTIIEHLCKTLDKKPTAHKQVEKTVEANCFQNQKFD